MAALVGAVVGFPGILAAGALTATSAGLASGVLLILRLLRWGGLRRNRRRANAVRPRTCYDLPRSRFSASRRPSSSSSPSASGAPASRQP